MFVKECGSVIASRPGFHSKSVELGEVTPIAWPSPSHAGRHSKERDRKSQLGKSIEKPDLESQHVRSNGKTVSLVRDNAMVEQVSNSLGRNDHHCMEGKVCGAVEDSQVLHNEQPLYEFFKTQGDEGTQTACHMDDQHTKDVIANRSGMLLGSTTCGPYTVV